MAVDALLGPLDSLKEKRSVVRPLVAGLRRRFDVACAEVGHQDLRRRAEIGVSVVAADAGHCADVLDACERWLRDQPHIEIVVVHRTYVGDEELNDE